ncbi:MAG: diguanylate cyclase [Alphaproteobacteria bacterium]|nr:MAG: diguanylate cyclase [Alphaproteobacteria bacterium]
MKEYDGRDNWGYHQKAVALMKRYQLDPTPEHYSVFFQHVLGSDVELSRAIMQRLHDQLPLDARFCTHLYRHYIFKPASLEVHARSVGATQESMNMMLDVIRTTLSGANEGTVDVHKKLTSLLEAEHTDVHEMVKSLADIMHEMKDYTDDLRQHLRESQHQVEALKHNLETISLESQRDFLTNVYNRKALDQKIQQLIGECSEHACSLSMLVIDIDHFKKFNDSHGHLIGDEVLKMIAKLLTDSVKGRDVVGRFGGEEFVILLPATSLGGAMVVAEHIRKTASEKELRHRVTGASFGVVTISIGVAQYRFGGEDVSDWFARADEALYRSKNSGRNCVTQENITIEYPHIENR